MSTILRLSVFVMAMFFSSVAMATSLPCQGYIHLEPVYERSDDFPKLRPDYIGVYVPWHKEWDAYGYWTGQRNGLMNINSHKIIGIDFGDEYDLVRQQRPLGSSKEHPIIEYVYSRSTCFKMNA